MAIAFGVSGPNSTNGMSCASGTIAIGDGFRAIVRGDAGPLPRILDHNREDLLSLAGLLAVLWLIAVRKV